MPAKKKDQLTGLARPWKEGEWLTMPLAATAVYAGAAALTLNGISAAEQGAIVPVGFGVAGLLITGAAGMGVQLHDGGTTGAPMHRSAKIFTVASVGTACAWLTWSTAMSPFNSAGVLVLGAAAIIGSFFYRAVRFKQNKDADAVLQKRLARKAATSVEALWEWRFTTRLKWAGVKLDKKAGGQQERTRPCLICRATGVVDNESCMECGGWGRRHIGYRVHLLFSRTGETPKSTVIANMKKFEQVCGCLFEGAATPVNNPDPLRMAIDVDEVDVLGELVTPPPDNPAELTCTKPFRIGQTADGSPLLLEVGERHIGDYGITGSGKSQDVHSILRRVGWMRDCVVMFIDGKGGATIRGWMEPWLADGVNGNVNVPHPMVEYLALDADSAHLMLVGLRAAIDYRVSQHRGGQGKWKVDNDHPAILVICEEIAEFTTGTARRTTATSSKGKATRRVATASQVSDDLFSLMRLGRSERISFMLLAQRATVDVINGDMQSQIKTVIAHGGAADEGDSNRMLPGANWEMGRKLAGMSHPGSVMVRTAPGKPWIAGRIDYTDDEDEHVIPRLAAERSPYRPALDHGTAMAMHEAMMAESEGEYGWFNEAEDGGTPGVLGRWDQLRDVPGYGPDSGPRQDQPVSPAAGDRPPAGPAKAAPQPAQPTVGRLPDPVEELSDDTVDTVFAGIMEQFGTATAPDPTPRRDDDETFDPVADASRYAFVVNYVQAAGRAGTQVRHIDAELDKQGMGCSRKHIHACLNRALERGEVYKRPPTADGRKDPRWYPPEVGQAQQDVA